MWYNLKLIYKKLIYKLTHKLPLFLIPILLFATLFSFSLGYYNLRTSYKKGFNDPYGHLFATRTTKENSNFEVECLKDEIVADLKNPNLIDLMCFLDKNNYFTRFDPNLLIPQTDGTIPIIRSKELRKLESIGSIIQFWTVKEDQSLPDFNNMSMEQINAYRLEYLQKNAVLLPDRFKVVGYGITTFPSWYKQKLVGYETRTEYWKLSDTYSDEARDSLFGFSKSSLALWDYDTKFMIYLFIAWFLVALGFGLYNWSKLLGEEKDYFHLHYILGNSKSNILILKLTYFVVYAITVLVVSLVFSRIINTILEIFLQSSLFEFYKTRYNLQGFTPKNIKL